MGSINTLGDTAFTGLSDPRFSTPTKHIPPVPPVEDQVQIATIPSVAQVEQIQSATPSSLQAVLGDAILKLRTAAIQSTDPLEIVYLSGMADRFQRLAEDGDGMAPAQVSAKSVSSGAL